MGNKLPKGRQKGHIRKVVGLQKMPNGDVDVMRFYLGKDPATAEHKLQRIESDWATLKAAGHQWWTDEALSKLVADGVIAPKKLRGNHAARLIGDPMNAAELAPYVDSQTGLIKPEVAPKALDHGSRKVFGRLDVRSRFFEDLYTQALKDPLSTFERCSRIFGWSAKETAAFMFNVSGNMSMNPIAYDASEQGTEQMRNGLGDILGESAEVTDSDSQRGRDET
jgi:hypothetical protein